MNIIDLKQRFLKFEAVRGLYIVIAGCVGIYVALFYLEYVLQALIALLCGDAVLEGFRKIFYNPVKKEALKVIDRQKYITDNISPLPQPKVKR